MHIGKQAAIFLGALQAASGAAVAAPLVSAAGQTAAIPKWDLQSSSKANNCDPGTLGKTGADTSSWYHAPVSRCTLMGCLLAAGTYKDSDIWFSTNLQKVDSSQFSVNWCYRQEFGLTPATGQHFFIKTHGISSKADIYLNGQLVADKTKQIGSYAGHTYDVTKYAAASNALLIRTYPTDYNADLALGFVDWNPSPPDNGAGVWRNVEIKQTGQVALGDLRIAYDLPSPLGSSATVTLKATAQNLESTSAKVTLSGVIGGTSSQTVSQDFTIPAGATQDLSISVKLSTVKIWWPKQWGDQPLYTAQLTASVSGKVSDATETRNFGLRQVSSVVNSHDDTIFTVNGKPFQVSGGGYAPDMFLRWDPKYFENVAKYVLDMGMNTIRLEGKMEQPELYDIADRLGVFIMVGWECCDKWEAWSYNDEGSSTAIWTDVDYATGNASMAHEALMIATHPSALAFLVGSDFWPDDKATALYLSGLHAAEWNAAIISSAAKRGFPKAIGPSGMKMDGPYDWVPPNYWFDTTPDSSRFGSSFGFGSELGSGVGTPELGSLKKFLTQADMDDLWKSPNKGLWHMSAASGQFNNRKLYNTALYARFGAPTSLDDYLIKAQMMDYEATRSQYEGYSAMWNAARPATGLIYWMLNNVWPGLHWNQFDYYLHPAGSYFGTKIGSRVEHVAYDPVKTAVWLINHSLVAQGARTVTVDVVGLDGKVVSSTKLSATTTPNTSKNIGTISGLKSPKAVQILRLVLSDAQGNVLSRNAYWVGTTIDTLNWGKSDWYYTPVTKYADFKSINTMASATVSGTTVKSGSGWAVTLENKSAVPAVFVRLNLVDASGSDVVPVNWSDNYITLLPNEKLTVTTSGAGAAAVEISGKNIAKSKVTLA